jgi:hypothetical protein
VALDGGKPLVVNPFEIYLGSKFDGTGDWKVDLERRSSLAICSFNKLRKVLCASSIPLKLRIRIFKVSVSTVLLYASECWIAEPSSMIKMLRKKNWMFAWMLTHTRRPKDELFNYERAKKVYKRINLPGLAIRRKMTWLADFMHSTADLPSCDVHRNKKEWFTPWLFGLSWEEASVLSLDKVEWEKYITQCISEHALAAEATVDENSEEEEEVQEGLTAAQSLDVVLPEPIN